MPDQPTTPPPAPAAPSAPAPAAAPSAPAVSTSNAPNVPDNPFSDADFDAKFKAAGSDISPKGGDEAPPKPKEAARPAAAATSSPKPAADVVRTPKELREQFERTKAELDQFKTNTAALEQKIKTYEQQGRDTEALRARLDARDKEFDQLQGELRALKREASPEFKQKFEVPFERTARLAEQMLKGVLKADGTEASFDKDFVPLYRMPYSQAYAQARENFGDDGAPIVMEQWRELKKLDLQKQEAFEEEKKSWAEKEKQAEGMRVQQREQFNDAWNRVTKDLADTVEAYRDPVDDKEAAELRQKGYQIMQAQPKSAREMLIKNAHILHRVAAFGPNQLQISRLKSEISELEKQVESHKPRQPGSGASRPGGETRTEVEEDFADGLRKAVKG